MKTNVGRHEQVLRLAVGFGAMALAKTFSNEGEKTFRNALGLFGLGVFMTALTKHCPLNAALGIDNSSEAIRTPRRPRLVDLVAEPDAKTDANNIDLCLESGFMRGPGVA